MHIIAYKAG